MITAFNRLNMVHEAELLNFVDYQNSYGKFGRIVTNLKSQHGV